MSMRVQRLDPDTAGRIAAGEVIERPTSVVKELLDNALDAGSSRIDIVLQNGGRRLIQVTDNGCGMAADEAVLALNRFTTSKIRQLDDLTRLTTLGFRGEALPSIAAMAEVEIVTRPATLQEGVVVHSRGEPAPQARPIGSPVGTRVRVQRLFAHTPVRLNALKSVAREVQLMHELVAHYALAHPHVTFQLQHDGRRLLFTPASADVKQRLTVLFNRELATHMLAVDWQSIDLAVAGAVSAPLVHRGTRQRQYFWVNGRPIRSGLISAAVGRAYGMRLPPGRHPLVALGITLPPQFLDVNVHPRKQEVGFVHERAVFAAVQEAVDRALQRVDMDALPWEAEPAADWPDWPMAGSLSAESGIPYGGASPEASGQLWRPMGQVGNTFVVAGGSGGLILFDQHAAHESLLYARLIAAADAAHELEEPFTLTLPAAQRRWLAAMQPILSEMGIQLEPFGPDTHIVRSIPASLAPQLRAGTFLDALSEARQRLTPQSSPEEARDQLGAAFACRSAIRAGDALRAEQMQTLVDAIGQHRMPYTCPHGRPTYVMLSLSDLERRFLRLFPLDTSAGDC